MKILRTILLFFIILILSSCSYFTNDDNIKIDYNNDITNIGYTSVVYNNRIYYISNELGTAGVYSMNMDGSDVQMEVDNPSIKNLQVSNGYLYFIGLKGFLSKGHHATNLYTLYFYKIGDTEYKEVSDLNENIIAFYVSSEGNIFLNKADFGESIYLYSDSYLLDNYESKSVIEVSFDYNGERIINGISQIGKTIIISWFPDDTKLTDFKYSIGDRPYLVNMVAGGLVLNKNAETYQKDSIKAFYIDDKNIYCSYNEMIVIIDKERFEVTKNFTPDGLSENYNIEYITGYGNDVYIVANQWSDKNYRKLPLKNEMLYRINPDTFECTEILKFESKQRIIGLGNDYIILLDENEIYKVDLSSKTVGVRTKLCNAPEDIYNKNYTIGYAGDWMFLYKIYPETGSITYGSDLPGEQLLIKINVQTGEIINNEQELNFLALDSYK